MTATASALRRKPRLLIVEHEPDLRVLIQFAAWRSEVFSTICSAENGAAALELVRAGVRGERADMPPDIVFTDYEVPRINGLELAHQLRSRPETRGVAVALFSSACSAAERAAAVRAGCCAHFKKPDGLKELTTILKSLPVYSLQAADALARASHPEAVTE